MGRFPPWRLNVPRLVALVALLWVAVQALAEEPGGTLGVLYEVRSVQTDTPNFLFGTIHSEDPRVIDLPAPVQAAFAASPGFALEVVPDAAAIIKSMVTMTYTDGRTLREVLPEDLYWRTSEVLEGLGMPEAAYRDFKPWAVVTLLSVPPAHTGEFLDMRLYKAAVAANKQIQGLETMQEQLDIFDDLALCDQVDLLAETLDSLGRMPVMFEALTLAYLARDLDALMARSHQYLEGGDPRLDALFWEAAVDSRNRRMVERMAPLLEQGGWFVAVGALHLPSANGILSLLRQRGFQVRAVY